MLGVATLIIVMSVMNGFRTELTDKILGFNPHITIKPYTNNVSQDFYLNIRNEYKNSNIIKTFSSEAVIMMNDKAKGVLEMMGSILRRVLHELFSLEELTQIKLIKLSYLIAII